jgi:hypothetical protein
MKLCLVTALVAGVFTSGCASGGRQLVLDAVGPPAYEHAIRASQGGLVVYSAFDVHAHFSGFPHVKQYTDYKIYSEDGQLVQTVHNTNGTSFEGPKQVNLPPGTYRVVAHANGYGLVTVPVVLESNRTTTVHLEGGFVGGSKSSLEQSKQVRLPDGQIVGARADADKMAQHNASMH